MRKTILPVLGTLLFCVLAYSLLIPDPVPNAVSLKEGLAKRSGSPSIEDQLIHRILLDGSDDALDDGYGNSLVKVAPVYTLPGEGDGEVWLPLTKENRAFISKSNFQSELRWADQLRKQGFLYEAYYHYWLLEQSYAQEDAPGSLEIKQKRKLCEESLNFHPKKKLTKSELSDKKRIAFFFKGKGLVEIDPQGYGIPKNSENKFLAAAKAEIDEKWQKARTLFEELKHEVKPKSAAFYEASWKVIDLDRKLGAKNQDEILNFVGKIAFLHPDVICERLTEEIRMRPKSGSIVEENLNSGRSLEPRLDIGKSYSKQALFSSRVLAPVSQKEPHRALARQTKYSYKNMLRRKHCRVLKVVRAMLPPLARGTEDLWRRVGNQYLRVGDFKGASALFSKLQERTKSNSDAFKSLASRIRGFLRADSKFNEKKLAEDIPQFKILHPGKYQDSLRYLEGQLAIQGKEWLRAREFFGSLLNSEGVVERGGAKFYCARLDRQLLRVHVPKTLTDSGLLKVNLTRRNLTDIRFRFLKVTDSFVPNQASKLSVKKQVQEFFANQKNKELECVGEAVHSFAKLNYGTTTKSEHALSLPGEGLWVVEAVSGSLKSKFMAVCQSAEAFAIQFPESTIVVFDDREGKPLSEWSVYSQKGRYLGNTDEMGALVTPLDYDVQASKDQLSTVHCVKAGQYFQCSVKLSKRVKDKASARAAKIYVYTDRPLYQAGDTIHFKGVIRNEVVPTSRRPNGRYTVAAGEMVRVVIKQKETLVFEKSFVASDYGSFQGSYQFPKNTARRKYRVEVHYKKVVAKTVIELRDLNKPSYSIKFVAQKDGLRIFAGYSWGKAVPGAELECFIGEKLIRPELDSDGLSFLPMKSGEKASVGLRKGKSVLLVKSRVFHAPREFVAPKARVRSGNKKRSAVAKKPLVPKPAAKKEETAVRDRARIIKPRERGPDFELSLEEAFNPKTGTIVLKLSSTSHKPWSAWLALGDTAAYDFKRIHSKQKAKLVSVKVTRACDPCLYAHVLFQSGTAVQAERLRVPVRAALLRVEIETVKDNFEPGEIVDFDLWTRRLSDLGLAAEASLAVVDEVIYSLKDDNTPDIYDFFYNDRGSDCHFGEYSAPSCPAQDLLVQSKFDPFAHRAVNVEQKHFPFFESLADAYGVVGPRGKGCLATPSSSGCTVSVDETGRWLRRHQEEVGLWDSARFREQCEEKDSCELIGVKGLKLFATGLAIECFINKGSTHRFGRHKKSIHRAYRALLRNQSENGCLGMEGQSEFGFLNHLTATVSLAELFVQSRDFRLRKPLKSAINYILARQIAGSGWGFDTESKRANILMTAWAIHALKIWHGTRRKIPVVVFEDALSFVDSVTDTRGVTWFEKIGEAAPDWFNNKSDFVDYPEWTAMGLYVRLAGGQYRRSGLFSRGMKLLQSHQPTSPLTGRETNFQYFYFATHVMSEIGGIPLKAWNSTVSAVEMSRDLSGCEKGSWGQRGRWGRLYGRVGNTALAGSLLGCYYRNPETRNLETFQAPVIRLYFPELAYWKADLRTNSKGKLTGRFKLPDTIGSFRLTSRGISKNTDVGQVVRWIKVNKDFFVQLHCPKYLYRKDRCEIRADVFDYQGRSQALQIELSGSGFRCQSPSSLTLNSKGNGAKQSVFWTLQALSTRELTINVKASCGNKKDQVLLKIPVKLVGEAIERFEKTLIEGARQLNFDFPKEAIPGSQELRLKLYPENSPFIDIFETLDFLVQFPYGCVEQTMSRFLPAVEVGDSFKQLGLPIDKFVKRFEKVTKKGVKRLAGFQKSNGSWGWFSSDAPNPFMTAYVVYGLSRAQKAGIKLEESMIKRGCAYLKTVVKEQKNNDLKSFIYFALQSAGESDLTEAKTLLDLPLSSYAKALLTLTFIRSGDRPAAEKLLGRLEKDRIDTGTLSHFSTPQWFYKWENVSIETSAFAMLAFLEVNPNHEIVPKLKDWLISKRQGKRWKTTKDSAAAIFALLKLLVHTEQAGNPALRGKELFKRRFKVTLNDKSTQTVLVDLSNPLDKPLNCRFDAKEVLRGRNIVKITGVFTKALGPVECRTSAIYVARKKGRNAPNTGLLISSVWDRDSRTLKVGDEVTVTVNVKTKQDFNYLMINVPIPAGAVVDRKSAKGDFAEFEARHDQGIFFLTDLKAGDHKLRFKFKCRFAGRFRVPGARGELMYSPNINGKARSHYAIVASKSR